MKRIVVCFDGTRNKGSVPDPITHVVKLAQAVRTVDDDGRAQAIYYNSWVESGGPFDCVMGGLFGLGIHSNVERASQFLSLNCNPEALGGVTLERTRSIWQAGHDRSGTPKLRATQCSDAD